MGAKVRERDRCGGIGGTIVTGLLCGITRVLVGNFHFRALTATSADPKYCHERKSSKSNPARRKAKYY